MRRYIIIFLAAAMAQVWTINESDSCVCSQWPEHYCTLLVGCKWNVDTYTCQNYSCSFASTAGVCNDIPYCYYNGAACVEYSSCQNVPYNNQTACNNVHGCYYYSGNTCSDFSCSQYSSNSTACTDNWMCTYSNSLCTQATSCSQYNQETCPQGQYCNWSGSQCVPATCSSQALNSCTFIYTSLSGSQIQPCISQDSQCVAASGSSQLTTESYCISQTDDLYYWFFQNGDTQNGQCISCNVTNPSQNSIIVQFALISIILLLS